MKNDMPIPKQFIYRVALRCLGESHEIQQIKIDEELTKLHKMIWERIEREEARIRKQEEDATAPSDSDY